MTATPAAARPDLRFAYIALACGGLIAALSFGVRAGFGLYLAPISEQLGYGREMLSLALAIQNLVWGATQPFSGALADRYGPFRAILIGAVIYVAGMVMFALSTTPVGFHLSAGVLLGVGLAGTSFGIILGAVSQLFPPERRSWALGITGASGSLGQFMIVPLAGWLIGQFGWQGAAMILAGVSTLMVPLAFVFLRAGNAGAGGPAIAPQSLKQALSEAFGYASFWFLVAGFFVCGFHVAYISVHLPAYVGDLGLPVSLGYTALSLVGLFNVIGSYSAGVLGGRYSKKYLLSSLYFGRAVVIALMLVLPPSEYLIYAFAASMGLLWLSTVPLTSGLVAQMFGPRYMSMLFGIVFFSHQIGAFIGSWLGGYVFDLTGSYNIVWWVSIGLGVFAGVMHWPIREQPIVRPVPA